MSDLVKKTFVPVDVLERLINAFEAWLPNDPDPYLYVSQEERADLREGIKRARAAR